MLISSLHGPGQHPQHRVPTELRPRGQVGVAGSGGRGSAGGSTSSVCRVGRVVPGFPPQVFVMRTPDNSE